MADGQCCESIISFPPAPRARAGGLQAPPARTAVGADVALGSRSPRVGRSSRLRAARAQRRTALAVAENGLRRRVVAPFGKAGDQPRLLPRLSRAALAGR